MTAPLQESLYALLPAIYRTRDLAAGEPLRALLGIIQEELTRIETDIAGLYDNFFIETCDDWVISYLGDLVGLQLVNSASERALTANTLAYRRRKGTLQTLAAVARDATTWTARSVEYMQLVATAQQINSARPDNLTIADLGQPDALESIGTPFEVTARTVNVRATGRYHRDQVGLFVWRRGSYLLERVRAVAASGPPGCFFMNPLGCDVALHNPANSRSGLSSTTQRSSAPQPLPRTVLGRALEARRTALVNGLTPQDPYFDGQPVLSVFLVSPSGTLQAVPSEQILIAQLDPVWVPPAQLTYTRSVDGQKVTMPIAVAVDPELGRLVFPAGQTPAQVYTSYYYGFSGELGGGGYHRELATPAAGTRSLSVSGGDPAGILQRLGDPTLAGSPWDGAGGQLCLEFGDSDTYAIGPLHIPPGGKLELRARSWQRPLLAPTVSSADRRWPITLGQGATLALNGLLITGALLLDGEPLPSGAITGTTVTILHCTLVPGLTLLASGQPAAPTTASVQAGPKLAGITLTLDTSISGAIDLSAAATGVPGASAGVIARDSILDAAGSSMPALQATVGSLTRVTVLGATTVGALEQTVDTLFCSPVLGPSGTPGGVSYCYLPAGSQVPGPYRCQPAMGLAASGIDVNQTTIELVPWFVSRRYGSPGYGQLDARCHPAIRNGASVQGELGALQFLEQAQRASNLLACQAEYLRFGITLNLFPVT